MHLCLFYANYTILFEGSSDSRPIHCSTLLTMTTSNSFGVKLADTVCKTIYYYYPIKKNIFVKATITPTTGGHHWVHFTPQSFRKTSKQFYYFNSIKITETSFLVPNYFLSFPSKTIQPPPYRLSGHLCIDLQR